MKANFKKKMFYTDKEMDKYIQMEWDSKVDKIYESAKIDCSAQIMAVCLTALNKNFGFGKKRLQEFYKSANEMFRLMNVQDGICGSNFSPIDCIEYIKQFGIDVDKKQ